MKKAMLLAALAVVACAKPDADKAAMDSAAMAAGPAPLTAADMAGTWNGTAMAEGSDSVLFRFVAVSPNGMDGKTIIEGQTDSVQVMHMFDGDSVIATSVPYTDQMAPGKPQVTFRAVGRKVDGKIVGRSTTMLASKPDSVVGRIRFEMTKAP
jgi:hypothetical protein